MNDTVRNAKLIRLLETLRDRMIKAPEGDAVIDALIIELRAGRVDFVSDGQGFTLHFDYQGQRSTFYASRLH